MCKCEINEGKYSFTHPHLDIQPPLTTLHPLYKLHQDLLLKHYPVGLMQSNTISGTW